VLVNGAGATLPYPLYARWFDVYASVDPSARFNYQSIGSGGGIRQIIAGTVDFAATDCPVSDADLRKAPRLLHVPLVIGTVAVTYRLPQTPTLRLTPDVLADIFLGRIARWDDARLVDLNPDVALPHWPIAVVHRSDGSGTTWLWTDYLAKVSPEWQARVGRGMAVRWPVGLGAKGNEGVTGQVKNLPGAIAYIEHVYAVSNGLPVAAIRNRAGVFVEPSVASATSAAAGTEIPEDLRVSLTDARGVDAYPIAGFTWFLVRAEQPDAAKRRALVRFLSWAIRDGQRLAPDLLYAPLPARLVPAVEATIAEIR
jgi:phosphate transport system substrate-binding protein